jgi:hypothetical protein
MHLETINSDLEKYYENIYSTGKFQFHHLVIEPFNKEQISQFIHHWYEAREWNPRERSERTETLEAAIVANERLAQLAVNPLMLSMIAMVHRKLARLPEERAELYRILTESLLEHWELQKYKNIIPGGNPLTTKMRRMEHLAEHMMTLSPEDKSDKLVILILEEEVKRIFKQAILEKEHLYRGKVEEASREADNFLQYIKTRTGLFMERGRGNYAFVHLSFQEYLTASYLKRYYIKIWENFRNDYGKRLLDSRWQETLSIFFEIVSAIDPANPNELLTMMLEMDKPPLHLMTTMIYTRPELEEENEKKVVNRLCQRILMQYFDPLDQVQKDWRDLIKHSYVNPSFFTIGEYCWERFLENMPKKKGKAMRQWCAHFITCDQWAADTEKTKIFFEKAWSCKSDHYILECLTSILPDFPKDKQKLIEQRIVEKFKANAYNSEPELFLAPLLFSEHCPDSFLGPMAACIDFFVILNLALARVLDRTSWVRSLDLDRALALAMALTQDQARALYRALDKTLARVRNRAMNQAQALDQTLDRALDQAQALVRIRAVIDFSFLMENKSQPGEGRNHKRISSFWINIGYLYFLLTRKEKVSLDKNLTKFINHPKVQPDMTDPWEQFGFTLYQLAKSPRSEKKQADLNAIIEKPGDEDLERLLRFLHLKQ